MSAGAEGPPEQGIEILETRIYYDPASGEILHVQQYAIPSGGERPSPERLREVMEARTGPSHLAAAGAEVPHVVVDAATLTSGARYRVDVDRGSLVEVEAPEADAS